jgi:hypothetical protein
LNTCDPSQDSERSAGTICEGRCYSNSSR